MTDEEKKAAAADAAAAAKAEADKTAADKAAAEKATADAAAAAEAAKKGKTSDEAAALLKEVMEKKAALKARDEELAAATLKLKEFEGIDPVAIKKLLADQKTAEEAQLEAKGEWKKLKDQMNVAHAAELTKKDGDVKVAQDEATNLKSVIAELTVGNSFGNSKFIQEEVSLSPQKVRALYGSHFEFKDGAVVAYDKPAGTKDRTMLIDGKGEALPFEEALTKIIGADSDNERILKSKMKPGAGSATLNKGKPDAKVVVLSGVNKIAAGLAARAGKK